MKVTSTRRAAALAGLLLLAGCGGGLWVGYRWDGDDNPPRVTAAVFPTEAAPLQTVRLTATANDADGIDRVWFYRLDGESAVRVATDHEAPFETIVTVPGDGRGTLRLFAEAVDGSGQLGTSGVVTVTVR